MIKLESNDFPDNEENKSKTRWSKFDCFHSQLWQDSSVDIWSVDIYLSIKIIDNGRMLAVIFNSRRYCHSFTSNLLQRKEVKRVGRQWIYMCERLFKILLTETNHQWHEPKMIISSFDWWSVCVYVRYSGHWVTEMQTSSSDKPLFFYSKTIASKSLIVFNR